MLRTALLAGVATAFVNQQHARSAPHAVRRATADVEEVVDVAATVEEFSVKDELLEVVGAAVGGVSADLRDSVSELVVQRAPASSTKKKRAPRGNSATAGASAVRRRKVDAAPRRRARVFSGGALARTRRGGYAGARMRRRDAAAATWIFRLDESPRRGFRGDESPRRRGRDADIRRPRERRGDAARAAPATTPRRLESTNPTADPATSPLLNGVWDVAFQGYAPGPLPSPTRPLALALYAGGFTPGIAGLAAARLLPDSFADAGPAAVTPPPPSVPSRCVFLVRSVERECA